MKIQRYGKRKRESERKRWRKIQRYGKTRIERERE